MTGGALIIVGEDYGEGSSIMQERSHAFAMKSQIWLLDPRPNLESIVKAVHDGFELSEASNTPVMLEVRIRLPCARPLRRPRQSAPAFTLAEALDPPRATNRIVLPPGLVPARAGEDRAALAGGGRVHPSAGSTRRSAARIDGIGIVMQGGMYNGVIRALERLGLADIWGDTRCRSTC